MFKLVLLVFVLCGVLHFVVSSKVKKDGVLFTSTLSSKKNDCPELTTYCTCNKVKGRAKCWNIMEIPSVPPEIQILELSDNAIMEVKRSDFKHNTLTDLFLDNNKIALIDRDAFEDLSGLTQLNLSNNRLRVLDKYVFKKNKNLKNLYINNNPDLNFSLSELPLSIEQLNVADTNIMITYNIIQNLSNLHSYSGNFCLKTECSHSTKLNVKFIRDDGSTSPITDTTQTTTKETSSVVADSSNLKTDPQTTTAESLPLPKESKMMDEENPNAGWSGRDITYFGIEILQILVQIIGFIVFYKMLTKILMGCNLRTVPPDQEPLHR